MFRRIAVGAAAVAALLAVFLLGWFLRGERDNNEEPTDDDRPAVVVKGRLFPRVRRLVYSPVTARVAGFPDEVQSGGFVRKGKGLVRMDDAQLAVTIKELQREISAAEEKYRLAQAEEVKARGRGAPGQELANLLRDKIEARTTREGKAQQLQLLVERNNADLQKPGEFWLKAPFSGVVLTARFRERFTNRVVKPNEPLLRLGKTQGPWEIEVKIPQRQINRILGLFAAPERSRVLDVDLALASAAQRTFQGKLDRRAVGTEVTAAAQDNGKASEPVVTAYVRLDGSDIPPDRRIPRQLLVADTEVECRIGAASR